MEIGLLAIIGAAFAFAAALIVSVEYVVLVDLRKNLEGKMFFTLLLTIDILLGLNAARTFFGDYPMRIQLLTFFFYILGGTISGIGVLLWKRQSEGAKADRRARHTRR